MFASVALAALSPTVLTFVIARLVQGVAAAAIVAASLALIAHEVSSGAYRTQATGIWGAGFGAGVALGPVLSATAADIDSWRLGYLTLAVLTVAPLALSRFAILESTAQQTRGVGWLGAIVLSVSLGALIAGLTEGRQGWSRPMVIVLLAVAVLALAGFIAIQRRETHPMLDLSLFRRPTFAGTTLAAAATGAGVTAAMSYLPTVLQQGQRVSVLSSSLMLWPGPRRVR
jgi:MFS family permease